MKAIAMLTVVLALGGCSRRSDPAVAVRLPTRNEIWMAIQSPAARYRIDPAFVYALVAAESNFDPQARNGSACGLLQLKPAAWRAVSTAPFEPGVWDWRRNLEAGIDYLAYSRSYLHRKTAFSYPLLLAAFHYGLDYVEERNFDVGRIAVPDNPIYRRLWKGDLAPLPVPQP
jgi:soluble lytic murein transglycosylase-like protein